MLAFLLREAVLGAPPRRSPTKHTLVPPWLVDSRATASVASCGGAGIGVDDVASLLRPMSLRAHRYNSSRCLSDPRGTVVPPRSCACGLKGTVLLRGMAPVECSPPSECPSQLPLPYFSVLPDGSGELIAIGTPSRLPLAHMAFELLPASHDSPWVQLRHVASGSLVVMQSPAAEGAWTLQLHNASTRSDWSSQFCFTHVRRGGGTHLYSAAAGGYVTRHGRVLLRGHGRICPRHATRRRGGRTRGRALDEGYQPTDAMRTCQQRQGPGERTALSHLALLRAPPAAWRMNARLCNCRRLLSAAARHTATNYEGGGGEGGGDGGGDEGGDVGGGDVGGTHAHAVPARPAPTKPATARRISVVTFASDANSVFCDTVFTAALQGLDVTVLGIGKPYQGNYQKLTAARAHLTTLDPDRLVLFVDAYDVLFAANEVDILERYASLHVPPGRVVFGAESGCFPDWMAPFGRSFCEGRFPKAGGEYRSLLLRGQTSALRVTLCYSSLLFLGTSTRAAGWGARPLPLLC